MIKKQINNSTASIFLLIVIIPLVLGTIVHIYPSFVSVDLIEPKFLKIIIGLYDVLLFIILMVLNFYFIPPFIIYPWGFDYGPMVLMPNNFGGWVTTAVFYTLIFIYIVNRKVINKYFWRQYRKIVGK